MNDFIKQAIRFRKSMEPLIQQIEQTNSMRKSMEPLIQQIEQTNSMINRLVPKNIIEIKKIQDRFVPLLPIKQIGLINNVMEGALEVKSPAFKSFQNEWGWLVNNKTFSFGDYCYALYKKQGAKKFKDTINRWFYHKKHLNNVLIELEDVFPIPRIKIIRLGFEFHQKRNYSGSINLLLPQAEGLLWDLGVKKGLVRRRYNSKEKKDGSGTWDLHGLSKQLFPSDKFHKIIIKEIFGEGFRNAVLHGRYIHRGKEKEITRWRSTLLILTLWRLSDEFQLMNLKK